MGHATSQDIRRGDYGITDIDNSYGYTRITNGNKQTDFQIQDSLPHELSFVQTHYPGICSKVLSDYPCPSPRVGHFTCIDKKSQIVYIGYGTQADGGTPSDVWSFDLKTYKWEQITLSGTKLVGRSGSRAIIAGKYILVFGGFSHGHYYSQLHGINLETGNVSLIQTHGEEPVPRSTPLLAYYDNKLFLWGGYNGAYPSGLSILNFANYTWTTKHSDVQSRTGCPCIQDGSTLYAYGSSRSDGMLKIDLKTGDVDVKPTLGCPPPSQHLGAGMCKVQHYLFYFGGKCEEPATLIYVYDIKTNHWFIFHVLPDGETVSLEDGQADQKGLFKLPNLQSFSVAYSKANRQIVAFLGAPIGEETEISLVSLGPSLGLIHHQEDMLSMLKF